MSDAAPAAPEELQVEIVDGRRNDGLPTIGLALIVKNEAETLGRLLDSVGWTAIEPGGPALTVLLPEGEGDTGAVWRPDAAVDAVVVCDTGSEDDTVAIARARGCRVVTFDWCDDFGKARQASYDALPAVDFTLWADGDDVIEGAQLLRQLAARLPADVAGTLHRYDYAQDPAGNCVCELWRERLVRRGIGESWELPIHEVLKVPGALMHVEEVTWRHRQPAERQRDPERNYKILKRAAEETERRGDPPDPRTMAYLGTEALTLGRPEEARELLERYLDLDAGAGGGWSEERCQVAHKLSIALRMLAGAARAGGKDVEPDVALADELVEASAQAAFRAIQERPDWADGYLDLAEIALDREQPERSLYFCGVAERLEPPRTILIINPLEYTYQPIVMRSVALAKLGRDEEAWAETQKALAITPFREDLLGQASMIARRVKANETVHHVLALREFLVRHDENAKADALMECVPYYAWDRPEIAQARLDQREMVLHNKDPEVYASYYRDNPGEAPFELQGVPIPDAHKAFRRVAFLRQGLEEQALGGRAAEERSGSECSDLGELRVLDLSMNDGWMLANLAAGGYGVDGALDGIDMNTGAVERANGRVSDFPALGTLLEGNLFDAPNLFPEQSYDAVVCFETIEHVPDPAALIDLMIRMVAPGGRVYVSTPDGAFEQGNLPAWAKVESKGHLRAMRPYDLCDLLCARGVVRDFARDQGLLVGSLEPQAPLGRIVFYAGLAEAAPEKLMAEGLGGSETALVKVAEGFARHGYDVRVFAGPPGQDETGGLRGDHLTLEEPKITGQVLYAPSTEWDPGMACDLFVSSRIPEAFDRTIAAPRRVLWLHDADYGDRLTQERIDRTTDVLFLSEFQRHHLEAAYPDVDFGPRDVVSRNGIEPRYFTGQSTAGGHRRPIVAYTSSPDRGLDVLLECWPAIRDRAEAAGVRKPELHHAYAPVYARFLEQFPHLRAFHRRLTELAEAAGAGVVDRGHLSQAQVAELYCEASVWAYPSWNTPGGAPFPEISCISAMEAQAGGAIPVCLDYGALAETVQVGRRIPAMTAGEPQRLTTAWREQFVDAIVEVLAGETPAREDERRIGRALAAELGWDGVVEEWEGLFLARAAEPDPIAA